MHGRTDEARHCIENYVGLVPTYCAGVRLTGGVFVFTPLMYKQAHRLFSPYGTFKWILFLLRLQVTELKARTIQMQTDRQTGKTRNAAY